MNTTTLKVGDRVVRKNFEGDVIMIRGVIVEIYHDSPNHVDNQNTLYAVKWDGTNYIEKGYLVLEKE